jgi:opacity protein-like surface antigen
MLPGELYYTHTVEISSILLGPKTLPLSLKTDNMKKNYALALVFSALTCSAFSQGFYIPVGLGYDFAQAGQTMYDSPTPYNGFPTGYNGTRNNTATNEIYNIKGASFSAGVSAHAGIGYMFSQNVGAQLDAHVGISPKKYTFLDENVALQTGSGSIATNITTTQQAKTPFIVTPSLVVQSNGNVLKAYSRFGVALPLGTKVTQHQVFANLPGSGAVVVDDLEWEIKSSFSVGFSAAAGLSYKLTDNISLWGELSMLSLTVNAREQDLKAWTENGQSVSLANYGNAQQIKFSKSISYDSTLSQLPTYSQPFSNIGVHVGITFFLGGRNHGGGHFNHGEEDDNKPFRRR